MEGICCIFNIFKIIRAVGDYVELRTYHSAAIIYDKAMIVYGGINGQGKFLNDISVFNLGLLN